MTKKQRLELTWIGKEIRPKLEPRILLEDAEKSYHAAHRVSENDIFDNRLIFGDNLLALKALEQEFTGKVKCVFIDPPYNTGSAFEHYDDGVEHSIWLSLMRDRLEIIRNLLSEDGSLWITIDDNEAHYLKVMCDEIFGRANFVANVVWQKKYAVANDHKTIAPMHDHILVYRKSESWQRNLLKRTEEKDRQYRYTDEKGVFRIDNYTCNKSSEERPNLYYPIIQPNTGEEIYPKKTSVWRYSKETHEQNVRDNLVYWGKDGLSSTPAYKRYKHLLKNQGTVPQTLWLHEYASHTDAARKEIRAVLGSSSLADDFITPKPEGLIQRVLEIATNPGDLVLDSFAGSGTTGAVAHKMGRRWIMIELGEHCHTHIIPRLKKVIDGEDKGGITETVNWKGGGGFRYYRLAPSLLEKDKWGNWVINKEYNPAMLAEALCKLEGFTYAPSDTFYWQHGYSTERDFIYVTTQNLSHEQLSKLSDEVGQERTLLILCSAFRGKVDIFPNLTIKKIPKHILSRCEWGHDDYSLDIKNLPKAPPEIEKPSPQKPQQQHIQQSLF
ncbi:site-specific DNA-methyltransferase [Sphaerospermopsis kisseleviana CS-549]|uniref:Site-specific DNA-methyltransferase n=1 Tax=Sphaerospermopsis kisseleviana CS-549 TaxID=3021783 RepID=A0ABT4ZRR5_9CYAN|nr:site-specific DNA-methyltransferase [Sphaerospermopsis kisseleviana]MDB9441714.1 site-specific DNA-methyltransferase [Sphaerospermopsis kisseleviana CS-549]BAZ78799.1 DNA methylase N-4/N-6 domain protein [Sphaerospermopsis kisseleviana NIES-73]